MGKDGEREKERAGERVAWDDHKFVLTNIIFYLKLDMLEVKAYIHMNPISEDFKDFDVIISKDLSFFIW